MAWLHDDSGMLAVTSHFSNSTMTRNGVRLHAFQPLMCGLWNLTADCTEFPMLLAATDGIEAMRLSLDEKARISSQTAAQSREIPDLHDDQTSVAPHSLRGVSYTRAAFALSLRLRSGTI
jgi:hypothetical protein